MDYYEYIHYSNDEYRRLQMLKDRYQEDLTDISFRLFKDNFDLSEYDIIWEDVKNIINSQKPSTNDLYFKILNCYMKYILKYKSKEIVIDDRNTIVKKIVYDEKLEKSANKNFNSLLTLLEREEFDYFINRYFYLDENVEINKKFERKISRVLGLRGDYFLLRFRGFSKLKGNPSYYPYYLLSINGATIKQIGYDTPIFITNKKLSNHYFGMHSCYHYKSNAYLIGTIIFGILWIVMKIFNL